MRETLRCCTPPRRTVLGQSLTHPTGWRSNKGVIMGGSMSNEVNKAIVRGWLDEFWNAGQLEATDEQLHPNYAYSARYGAGARRSRGQHSGDRRFSLCLRNGRF